MKTLFEKRAYSTGCRANPDGGNPDDFLEKNKTVFLFYFSIFHRAPSQFLNCRINAGDDEEAVLGLLLKKNRMKK